MKISELGIKIDGGGTKSLVYSIVTDENSNESKEIFFSVDNKYAEYLVTENADAFVLAVLLPALVTGQDIVVDAPISDYLYKHSKTLIYLLGKVFGYPPIKIIAKSVEHFEFNPKAVATGFSGGIDSFATYINHTDDECPENFRLTHLALFNVGNYGNKYNSTHKSFSEDILRAQEFAKEVNIPLVLVDSNIAELYDGKPIITHFSSHLTTSITSAIFVLQKLFKRYYISSAGTIDYVKLENKDMPYYENMITQLFSNNNTEIFIAEATLDRVEKTKIVADYSLASDCLYVCAADVFNNNNNKLIYKKGDYLNCGECLKCTRTLITLDFLGKLQDFSTIFDIEKYYKMRDDIIVDTYLWKDINHFKREIYDLMQSTGYKLPEDLEQRVIEKLAEPEFIKLQSKYPKL